MGRYTTCPTTIEECKTISLKDLRIWGYLKPSSWKSGTINYSRNGNPSGSIGISVCTYDGDESLRIFYTLTNRISGDKKEINYKVKLISFPANIGGGSRYYFLCPFTQKRCFKLYSPPNEDYFLHRSAFPYLIYGKQCESKLYKELDRSPLGLSLKLEKLEEGILWNKPKYAKLYYKGKPTRRMKKYLIIKSKLGELNS